MRDVAKHRVAAGVPELVVDGLEVIDIEHEHGHVPVVALGLPERRLSRLVERATVVEAREEVRSCEPFGAIALHLDVVREAVGSSEEIAQGANRAKCGRQIHHRREREGKVDRVPLEGEQQGDGKRERKDSEEHRERVRRVAGRMAPGHQHDEREHEDATGERLGENEEGSEAPPQIDQDDGRYEVPFPGLDQIRARCVLRVGAHQENATDRDCRRAPRPEDQ